MIARYFRFCRIAVAIVGAIGLSACLQTTASTDRANAGFSETRAAENIAIQDWRECREEALTLDRLARQGRSAARYLGSARLLEKCEIGLEPSVAKRIGNDLLRADALTIQNYLKGGDVAQARENLAKLKSAFPEQELRFPDGSSVIATMELLLDQRDRDDVTNFASINASEAVKMELRRVRYWKRN